MSGRARIAAVAVLLGTVAYFALIRDPFGGNEQFVHKGTPSFNVLYKAKVVKVVKPRGDELLRMRTRRGPLTAITTVRRLRLPPYEGDVAGLLPVFADAFARERGLDVTADTRARVHGAPGYELGYETPAGEGTFLMLIPKDEPGTRDGVLLQHDVTKPPTRQKRRVRKAARAARSAFRSFQFGPDRY